MRIEIDKNKGNQFIGRIVSRNGRIMGTVGGSGESYTQKKSVLKTIWSLKFKLLFAPIRDLTKKK